MLGQEVGFSFSELGPVRVVCVLIGRLHSTRVEVPADGPEKLGSARLCYQLNNAATHVAILRLETTRFDLNFFHEGKVDPRSQWAIDTRPDSNPAEGWIIDGDAVRHI